MKKFDLETSCRKCGYLYDNASVEYKVGIFSNTNQENISTAKFGGLAEYLLRTCLRCGYNWPERTIDKCE